MCVVVWENGYRMSLWPNPGKLQNDKKKGVFVLPNKMYEGFNLLHRPRLIAKTSEVDKEPDLKSRLVFAIFVHIFLVFFK